MSKENSMPECVDLDKNDFYKLFSKGSLDKGNVYLTINVETPFDIFQSLIRALNKEGYKINDIINQIRRDNSCY